MLFRSFLLSLLFCSSLYSVEYQAKDYNYLLGQVSGIDDQLLTMHFTLYKGYVANTNKLLKELGEMEETGKMRTPEFAGLKRMFGWEFDGMRLHEYYFENLGKSALSEESQLYKEISDQFGSMDRFKEELTATGLIRGIGWVILYRDPKSRKLIIDWVNEHDAGHLAGATPLLVMDVFEHAYITQYGLDRAGYIQAFIDNINWERVQKRSVE